MHKITKRKVWQCGFTNCDNKFDTRIEAEMHMWLCNHRNDAANVLVFNVPVRIPEWQCDTCGIVFGDEHKSDRHVYLCALESGEIAKEKAKVEEQNKRALIILGKLQKKAKICKRDRDDLLSRLYDDEEPITRARLILGQIFYLVTDSTKTAKDYEKILDCMSGLVKNQNSR